MLSSGREGLGGRYRAAGGRRGVWAIGGVSERGCSRASWRNERGFPRRRGGVGEGWGGGSSGVKVAESISLAIIGSAGTRKTPLIITSSRALDNLRPRGAAQWSCARQCYVSPYNAILTRARVRLTTVPPRPGHRRRRTWLYYTRFPQWRENSYFVPLIRPVIPLNRSFCPFSNGVSRFKQ